MSCRNDTFQQGNSTLIFSIMLAAVTGIGVKVASDRQASQASQTRTEKQSEWGENAIEAAVARAQALLSVRPGTPKQPGEIMAEPLSTNLSGTVSLKNNSANPVGWTLVDHKTLRLTMAGMGGADLDGDQVVTLSFSKPIVTRSPVDNAVQLLRGFEVIARTTIKRRDGSTFELTRPKQVIVEPGATGGTGGYTECKLEGPGYTMEPNVSATAKLFVKGRALVANVPRTADELGQAIVAVNENLTFDGNKYSVPASANVFFTRYDGAMAASVPLALRNDITLPVVADADLDDWQEYSFKFAAPRPLTAVDGGTVTFPMWATVKLSDGTWKKCDQTTVTVRQVTSCEFSAPSSPEIDYSEPNLVVDKNEYNDYAALYARKGYDVPGCKDTCSSYKSSSTCNSHKANCFWYDDSSLKIKGCYYKDPAAFVNCEKVGDPDKTYTLTKPEDKIPTSTSITWKQGQGGGACSEMTAEIQPPPDDRYYKGNKFIGEMPKITVNPSCTNKTIKIEVDSKKVPPGLYRVYGKFKSNQGVGTCFASVKVGFDPCKYTNRKSSGQNLGFPINFYGKTGTHKQTVTPRAATESEYYALSPTDVVDCATNDARCYYVPPGPGTNRTLFVHVDSPNLPTCNIVPVSRINLGCFAYGSKILMGDGRWLAGESVKRGDYVWNPVIKMPVPVIETTSGPERPALVKIETASGEIVRVTRNHPVLTSGGLKAAKDIKIGDLLRKIDGNDTTVTNVTGDKEKGSFVWNVRLDGRGRGDEFHYVLVDGIITGDLTLQENLETALKLSHQK
jgi:hypothetical protein